MKLEVVEKIANTVLYEGYILYPYRASALKNQQRFNFGVVYPRDYGLAYDEQHYMQTECLVLADAGATLDVRVRFLHLLMCENRQEAVEREVNAPNLKLREMLAETQRVSFTFLGTDTGPEQCAETATTTVRLQQAIAGEIEIAAEPVSEQAYKINLRILNQTPVENVAQLSRADVLLRSLVSTHTILNVHGGEFVSLLDPPAPLREAAAACRNIGTWPVLVGAEAERDVMLSSPIILYDYPQIAPESIGDFFDGTEIDELLSLRILTLTDEEKRELREGDARARQLLEKVEALPVEQLLKLHGVVRGLRQIEEKPL